MSGEPSVDVWFVANRLLKRVRRALNRLPTYQEKNNPAHRISSDFPKSILSLYMILVRQSLNGFGMTILIEQTTPKGRYLLNSRAGDFGHESRYCTPLFIADMPPFDPNTPLCDAGTPLFDAGTPPFDAGIPFLIIQSL